MLDLKPLLNTLSKVSGNRVLPDFALVHEDDIYIATIPVQRENPGDRADRALRKYARDWVRKQGNFSVEDAFEKFKPEQRVCWDHDDGRQTPIAGAIRLTWWKRPELSDREKLELARYQSQPKSTSS